MAEQWIIQVQGKEYGPVDLKTLREWKAAGTIRYLGITHYHAGAYRELERLLKTREYDFVQFNYSLAEREAEQRLLTAAAESRTAVIINRPFAQGELFAKVKGRDLPAWAAEFDCASWAQFFLKYIVYSNNPQPILTSFDHVRCIPQDLQLALA